MFEKSLPATALVMGFPFQKESFVTHYVKGLADVSRPVDSSSVALVSKSVENPSEWRVALARIRKVLICFFKKKKGPRKTK